MRHLYNGLHQFKQKVHGPNLEFYKSLSKGQSPKAIFVTCADSRVDPNLITQTGPGDLFVIRNAGNIVPAYNEQIGGEAASIEYGVDALGIKDIIVCGHTHCGAMKGLLNPDSLTDLPHVRQWLHFAQRVKEALPDDPKNKNTDCVLNIAVQENVLLQVRNVKSLPTVARKISSGEVTVHAWVYEIDSGTVYVHSEEHNEFLPVEMKDGVVDLVKHKKVAEECALSAPHLGHA